ncbi:YSC84-related protein [Hypericibacter sp.]|uniref:lipid-binding SYLF domain-containing protein n=1 Tax=Hypericibacter sp. TaxID=2705401 RepID=UPI003D6D2143
MMGKRILGLVAAMVMAVSMTSAALAWDPAAEKKALDTVAMFKKTDPSLQAFFDKAYGYAVFPEITKGAIGIGGARGEGTVFQGGKSIGSTVMSQVTIGLQLGGQTYSEIIFFQNKAALDAFTKGNYEFSANASAIAAKDGASKTANYNMGVAIFTAGTEGLMFEASIGGQKFSYTPK